MADAFEMTEDRHTGFLLHARDKAFAATRHDEVERAFQPGKKGPTASRSMVGTIWIASFGKPTAARPRCRAATMAADERKPSEPPRKIAALPDFMASAPASAVTLGRLS
jgi:hypothetical protein